MLYRSNIDLNFTMILTWSWWQCTLCYLVKKENKTDMSSMLTVCYFIDKWCIYWNWD